MSVMIFQPMYLMMSLKPSIPFLALWPQKFDHYDNRLQRGDSRVQKSQVHILGRWGPTEVATTVETLLPQHSRYNPCGVHKYYHPLPCFPHSVGYIFQSSIQWCLNSICNLGVVYLLIFANSSGFYHLYSHYHIYLVDQPTIGIVKV